MVNARSAPSAPRFQGKLRHLGAVRLSVGACCFGYVTVLALSLRTDFPRICIVIPWQYDFAQRDPLVHLCIGRSEHHIQTQIDSIPQIEHFRMFFGWVMVSVSLCYVLLSINHQALSEATVGPSAPPICRAGPRPAYAGDPWLQSRHLQAETSEIHYRDSFFVTTPTWALVIYS